MEIVSAITPQLTGGGIEWLSPRQRDVLSLIAQGYSNPAIGRELNISVKSVENYVNSIFSDLGLAEIRGRQKRVLAALGYHYGLGDARSLALLGRFVAATRERRDCRSRYDAADERFNQAKEDLTQNLDVTVTPLDEPLAA